MDKKNGFTMIELLTTMAIVAILMAAVGGLMHLKIVNTKELGQTIGRADYEGYARSPDKLEKGIIIQVVAVTNIDRYQYVFIKYDKGNIFTCEKELSSPRAYFFPKDIVLESGKFYLVEKGFGPPNYNGICERKTVLMPYLL